MSQLSEDSHPPRQPTTRRDSHFSCDDGEPSAAAVKVFADWLLWLPQGADLCAAARAQIASIDRRALSHPDTRDLRTLLVAVAGGNIWRKPSATL